MSSQYDDDTFAMQFDDAVNSMHQRLISAPGTQIWQKVEGRMASSTPLKAYEGSPQRSRRHNVDIPACLAIALVMVLIASGFYLSGNRDKGDLEQNLAWAPATAEATISGESLCTAQPLTTDEVMSTIKNPFTAYARFGHAGYTSTSPDELIEISVVGNSNWTPNSELAPVSDNEVEHDLTAFAELFWGCLQTGTVAQVWSLMDPVSLQSSILQEFPVIRTEGDLTDYINLWGPKSFTEFSQNESSVRAFPMILAARTMTVANNSDHPMLVSDVDDLPGATSRYAIIPLITTNENDPVEYYDLYVTRHPDGSWIVVQLTAHQKQVNNSRG